MRVLPRTNLAYSSSPSTLNPRHFIRLQPLCRPQKSQLLWNQANPASFVKTPGVWGGHPDPIFGLSAGVDEDSRCRRRNYGTPGRAYPSGTSVLRSQRSLCCASSCIFARHSSLATRHFLPSTFRINTCKSASKQTTLSPFRINTCEKPGEGGRPFSPLIYPERRSRRATRHSPLPLISSRLCSRAAE